MPKPNLVIGASPMLTKTFPTSLTSYSRQRRSLDLNDYSDARSSCAITSPVIRGNFIFDWLREPDFALFTDLVTQEIGLRYPETGFQYAKSLTTAVRGNMIPFGAASLSKSIIACYKKTALAGFTLVTEKIEGSIKFGPTIVVPSYRGQGVAGRLRELGEQIFSSKGYTYAYSTCQEGNTPAKRYVVKAGYKLIATLRDQYSSGVNELVYGKNLHQTSPQSKKLTIPDDQPNPRMLFGIIPKRGGAAKFSIPIYKGLLPESLLPLFEEAMAIAHKDGIRRVYLHLPPYLASNFPARRLAFTLESHSTWPGRPLIFGRVLTKG